jgi:hypothetical protein
MQFPPPWKEGNPPKDRPFLAYATLGIPELTNPLRLVVEWEKAVEQWRPVKAPGDHITGTKLKIICWCELPAEPKTAAATTGQERDIETPRDEKVAQYLAGRSRVTIEQVCLGIGLKYASSHDHGEIARAMENAGWHSPLCDGCVDIWEAGPKADSASPQMGLLGVPET